MTAGPTDHPAVPPDSRVAAAEHAPGRHWLVELCEADPARLRDLAAGLTTLRGALTAAGFTILGEQSHTFPGGGGYTALFLLSESHASIHTWPERGYAAFDLFTCGNHDAATVVESLAALLGARVHGDVRQRGS